MFLKIGDDERYEFDERKILNVEAIAMQKVTGMKFGDLLKAASAFDAEAITALVWIFRKRADPQLRYSDVEFPLLAIDFESTEEEEAERAAQEAAGPKAEPEPASEPGTPSST